MSSLLMGVDAGTSAVKVQIINAVGQVKAESSRSFAYVQTDDNGVEYEPDLLWQTAFLAIKDALAQIDDPSRIIGIACAGVGESGVLVDGDGAVCSRSLAWYDSRPVEQLQALIATYGQKDLVEHSGMRATSIAGLCKLMWMRDHHSIALGRAKHWLHVSDFIAFRLSGEAATDLSLAGRTLALDLASQSWNLERLKSQSIPEHLMPPLKDNGQVIGTILGDLARDLGLDPQCKIVNGGHDHLVGALACNVFGNNGLLDSLGTAEAVMLPIDDLVEDERIVPWGVEQGMLRIKGEPLHYMFCGLNTASACIEWFRQEIANNQAYEELAATADAVAEGSGGLVFLPYLRGTSPPFARTGHHGAFLNIGTHVDIDHMFRAILEGLAFEGRRMTDCLVTLMGREGIPTRIVITGGSSQNELLMQLKANIYDRTLDVVTAPQSVSLGAALLAGLGAGTFASWREAVAKAGAATRTVLPDHVSVPTYQMLYEQNYLPTVNGLQDMVRRQP